MEPQDRWLGRARCRVERAAAALIERVRLDARRELDGWVLHSDNGGPMKGATMLATLQRLGVVPSFSQPRVSDDNPFAESLFRTLEYRPEYPAGGFATIDDAEQPAATGVANDVRAPIDSVRLSDRHEKIDTGHVDFA